MNMFFWDSDDMIFTVLNLLAIIPTSLMIVEMMVVLSRIIGGLKPKLPSKLSQLLYALPYGYVVMNTPEHPVYLTLLTILGAFGATCTGRGQWMALPFSLKFIKPEFFDFLLVPLFGNDPRCSNYYSHLRGRTLTNEDKMNLQDTIEREYGADKLRRRNEAGLILHSVLITATLCLVMVYLGEYLVSGVMLFTHCFGHIGYKYGFTLTGKRHVPPFGLGSDAKETNNYATVWGEIGLGLSAAVGISISLAILLIKDILATY